MARSRQYRIMFKSTPVQAMRFGMYMNVYTDRSVERGYVDIYDQEEMSHPFKPGHHTRDNVAADLKHARYLGYTITRKDL